MSILLTALHTHRGPRAENQDYVQAFGLALQTGNDHGNPSLAETISGLLLGDGVSQAKFGYEASHRGIPFIGSSLISNFYQAAIEKTWSPSELFTIIQVGFAAVNRELWRLSQESGAGSQSDYLTTLALVVHAGNLAFVAHCGDSPVFLYRCGQIEKLTREHTRVNDLLAAGIIDERLAKNHPDRSVISRAVGMNPHTRADFKIVQTQPGDILVLASDGITGVLSEAELATVIEDELRAGSTQYAVTQCAIAIVNRALAARTSDNASVALGLVVEPNHHVTRICDALDTGVLLTERGHFDALA